METRETPTTTYCIDDGILSTVVKKGVMLSISDLKTNREARNELMAGRIFPILIDIRQMGFAAFPVIAMAAKMGDPEHFTASALLVSSARSQAVAAFVMKFQRPKIPTRVFSDQDKAMAWLAQFRVTDNDS